MNDDELELGHYGRIFRRSWWMLALAVVSAVILALVAFPAQENFYVSNVSVLLSPGEIDGGSPNEQTETGIATSSLIGSAVISQEPSLDLKTWRENLVVTPCLDGGIVVNSNSCNTQILEMSYRGETPEQASFVVNATAEAYLNLRTEREQNLKDARITDLESKFEVLDLRSQQEQSVLANAPEDSVEATISELRLRSIESEKLVLVNQLTEIESQPIDVGSMLGDPSEPEADASGLPRSLAVLAGVLMGLLLGGLAAVLSDRLDRRVSSAAETEIDLGVPVLGDIPRITEESPALVTALGAETPGAEAFRRLAAAVLAPRNGFVVDSIAITGANENEGRTTASVNLAVAIAQTGRGVLLVASDRRNDAVDRLFGIALEPGLNDFLRAGADLDAARAAIDAAPQRLGISVLPTGTGAPTPLSNNGISALLHIAEERGMVVVFDSPPALTHADGLQLAAVADAVYIVAAVGRTRRSELAELRVQLLNVQADVVGAIVNRNSRLSLLPSGTGDVGTVTVPSGIPGNRPSTGSGRTFGAQRRPSAPQASPVAAEATVIYEDDNSVEDRA